MAPTTTWKQERRTYVHTAQRTYFEH
jgi:hypothetical protein